MCTKKRILLKIVAMMLIVVCVFPVKATATDTRASDYINYYSGYIYNASLGKVQVWFDVEATRDMDELGALEIQLYESTDNVNFTWVKTFTCTDYPDMLGYDNYFYSGHVQYKGYIGRYYKAHVCIWAGKDGGGDSRWFWTQVQRATPFAGQTTAA